MYYIKVRNQQIVGNIFNLNVTNLEQVEEEGVKVVEISKEDFEMLQKNGIENYKYEDGIIEK